MLSSICTAGMEDLDCGPHLISLPTSSTNASLNLSIIDDEVEECDEKFIAEIILGEGNSSEGFRRGPPYKISITVKDYKGDVYRIYTTFCTK